MLSYYYLNRNYPLYFNMDKWLLNLIKEKKLKILNQKLELDGQITISVRKNESEAVFETFKNLFEVSIKKLNVNSI